jgi:hypothetical protein
MRRSIHEDVVEHGMDANEAAALSLRIAAGIGEGMQLRSGKAERGRE